jgi:hypothetical protein
VLIDGLHVALSIPLSSSTELNILTRISRCPLSVKPYEFRYKFKWLAAISKVRRRSDI